MTTARGPAAETAPADPPHELRGRRATADLAQAATAAGALDREAWIELAAVSGIGDERFAWLLARYGTPSEVLRVARDGGLRASRELPVPTVGALVAVSRSPGALASRLRALAIWTLTPFDAGYPARLASLEWPPPVLYGQGDPAASGRRAWWRWWGRVDRPSPAEPSPPGSPSAWSSARRSWSRAWRSA